MFTSSDHDTFSSAVFRTTAQGAWLALGQLGRSNHRARPSQLRQGPWEEKRPQAYRDGEASSG